jgi:hypothetical protein
MGTALAVADSGLTAGAAVCAVSVSDLDERCSAAEGEERELVAQALEVSEADVASDGGIGEVG